MGLEALAAGASPLGLVSTGLNLVGALFNRGEKQKLARAQRRAAQEEYARKTALAEPYQEVSKPAFEGFKSLLNLQAGQVGQENPFLAAAHRENLGDIEAEKARALAESERTWNMAGNTGRSRGEALRIGQAAVKAANRENMGYGTEQQGFKDSRIDRYARTLGTGLDLANTGTNILSGASRDLAAGQMGAAQTNADANTGFIGDLGGIAGDYFGGLEEQKAKQKYNTWMDRWLALQEENAKKGTKKGTPTTPTMTTLPSTFGDNPRYPLKPRLTLGF